MWIVCGILFASLTAFVSVMWRHVNRNSISAVRYDIFMQRADLQMESMMRRMSDLERKSE